MQKAMSKDVTGVPVTLSVLDSNGNYRAIGQTTTDTSGMFSFVWTPDIEGHYIVYANFEGTNSYYGSYAETSFYVTPAPATATPQPTQAPSTADLYFIPVAIGLFVVIIVGFAILLLMLRKRP
jgi:hypothetical protein